jgi:hypothetical protein
MSKFNLKGWNIKRFLIGRKKLLITIVGGIGGYVVTQNPALAAVSAAAVEMIYAVIEYYCIE